MKHYKRKTVRSAIAICAAFAAITVTAAPADAALFGSSSDYLVKITPATQAAVESAIKNAGGTVNTRFQYAFNGFVVKLPDVLLPVLKRIPNILTVEKDMPISGLAIQQNQTPTPSWGLDRVDQREPLSTATGYQSNYGYRSAGQGSTIYIGDTGIYPHSDLAGRISSVGYSGISDSNGTVDCNGHGTHVATTAAGTTYGVAKKAIVVPVRILGCGGMGSFSTVIAGLDWILSPLNTNPKTQAVVNLSIGGAASTSVNDAILKLTNSGITVVAAAGNDNIDACKVSPASAPSAITVGAVTNADTKASFSNWGSCVDINAPGVGITGGWATGPDATVTISGTSMATPHVTGAAAVFLGLNPGASVAQVAEGLTSQATVGVISGLTDTTPNKYLYVSPTDGGPVITPPAVQVRTVTTVSHADANIVVEINPGNAATTGEFQYSKDETFATGVTSVNLTPAPISGGDVIAIPITIDSLTASSTYYFRAKATNESGSFTSPVGVFKTIAPPVSAPTPLALPATSVTGWSARLNGSVNANNGSTNVSFVYGTDPDFKVNTLTGAAAPATVGGNQITSVGLDISFLNGGTTYYYKVVAGNSVASVESSVLSFKTPELVGVMPTVETIRPTGGLNTPSTTITGRVNPNGQTTTVRLVYGQSSSLVTGNTVITLPLQYTGIDTVTVTADMINLVPGTRYYYRFEALNSAGIAKPTPLTNTGNPVMPVVLSMRATAQTVNSLTLNASVNAGAGNLRFYFIYGTDPLLETGTTIVNATPFAIANGLTQNITAALSGLQPGTKYYYRVKMFAYTGPLAERGGTAYTPIVSTDTLYPPRLAQTITFTPPASRFFGGAPTVLSATSSAGLPVEINASPSNVCRIELVNGELLLSHVSPVTTGTFAYCTLAASQAGNGTYAPAYLTRTVAFTKENTVIKSLWSGPLTETGTVLDLVVSSSSQPTLNENLSGTTPFTVVSRTPSVCLVDSITYEGTATSHTRAIVHSLWNGNCQLFVTFAGYSYWSGSQASVSVNVAGMTAPLPGANAGQAINFTTPVNKAVGTPNPLIVVATSKLPVTLTSLTPAICSVSTNNDGTSVATSAAGLSGDNNLCQIQATQSGDNRWAAAATVVRSFYWIRQAQAITFNLPVSRFYGGAPTVLTASSTSGLPVKFITTTPAICTIVVGETQTVLTYNTPLPTGAYGSCLVTAQQLGDGTWSPAPAITRGILWQKEYVAITPTWAGNISETGTVLSLKLSSQSNPLLAETATGTTPMTVTSLTRNICTVEPATYIGSSTIHTQVTVKGLWNGTCNLQVNYVGSGYWLPTSLLISKSITTMKTPQTGANAAQRITFSTPATQEFGTLNPLTASSTSTLAVTLTSLTPDICSIETMSNGSFAAKSVSGLTGDNNLCSIQATQAGNLSWAPAAPVTQSFKWRRMAQTITFTMPSSRYYGGAPTPLIATTRSGLPIAFTTSTPQICQLNTTETGTLLSYVTPLPIASSASCSITVSQAGDGTYLPAPSLTRTMTWMKETTGIRIIFSGPISITGTDVDLKVVSAAQGLLGEQIGGGVAMNVTSTTPTVCKVNSVNYIGTSTAHTRINISSLWNGTCQLQMSFAGTSYWLPTSTSYRASVTGITTPQPGASVSQSISFPSIANREYGPGYTLNATSNSKLPVTYTSLTPDNCMILSLPNNVFSVQSAAGVSGNGVTCTVQASQAGDDRYLAAANVSRTFTWNKAAMVIRITNGVSARSGVGPFSLTASATFVTGALNSGLSSIGVPVSVSTTTPNVCQVLSSTQISTSSGLFTQASVKGTTNGVCTTVWSFAGSETRAPATTQYSFTFANIK
jgi:subtilisin family serine protease